MPALIAKTKIVLAAPPTKLRAERTQDVLQGRWLSTNQSQKRPGMRLSSVACRTSRDESLKSAPSGVPRFSKNGDGVDAPSDENRGPEGPMSGYMRPDRETLAIVPGPGLRDASRTVPSSGGHGTRAISNIARGREGKPEDFPEPSLRERKRKAREPSREQENRQSRGRHTLLPGWLSVNPRFPDYYRPPVENRTNHSRDRASLPRLRRAGSVASANRRYQWGSGNVHRLVPDHTKGSGPRCQSS